MLTPLFYIVFFTGIIVMYVNKNIVILITNSKNNSNAMDT